MKRLCLTSLLALLAAGASAQGNAPVKTAVPGDFPERANMRADALKQFDKDGDGKLNEVERKAMMDARMAMGEKLRKGREKQFDKDGDGTLNAEERKAMVEANKARMEEFRQAREKPFDKDGDGKLSEEERKAMMAGMQKRRPNAGPQFQEMMKTFDKDGDGKLDVEERKAMREARAKGPHREKPGAVPAAEKK